MSPTAVLPAPRARRWRCLLAGHRWTASTTRRGQFLVLCNRCGELVTAPFVDAGHALGGYTSASVATWLGDAETARMVVDLVTAAAAGDASTTARLREELSARPGESLDVLVRLSVTLAGLATSTGAGPATDALELISMMLRLASFEAEFSPDAP